MVRFDEKQGGRIFTDKVENIQKIKDILKAMDEFEFEYLPDDLISIYKNRFECVYNGKFYEVDLDELVSKCQANGIVCGYIIGHSIYDSFGTSFEVDSNSIAKCIQMFFQSGFWSNSDVLKYYNLDYLIK
jgi:hypothetical protein